MSLKKVKEQTSATEFIRWLKYYKDEIGRVGKSDYYLAQIAFEIFAFRYYFVRWTGDKEMASKKFKDFILPFTDEDKPPQEKMDEAPAEVRKKNTEIVIPKFDKSKLTPEQQAEVDLRKAVMRASFGNMKPKLPPNMTKKATAPTLKKRPPGRKGSK